jgi:hypothetical protein
MDPKEKLEDLRATLLEFEDELVLDALIENGLVDPETGRLTDWWLNLLNPALTQINKEAKD